MASEKGMTRQRKHGHRAVTRTWVDPDAAPELGDEWFKNADQHHNGVRVKQGDDAPENRRNRLAKKNPPG
ncbi:hypothetical protein ACTXK7_07340 [Vreelandella alkaliphila]|uniref:hypothetical protein n=1 Tax=Halomonadaceae TaxID=28256 RepID=UPI003F8DD8D4